MNKAIGMVEYKTVSTGIKAADLIVKTADVQLIQAQTVCPGKFIILFSGDLSAVRVCVDAAEKEYAEGLIDRFVLGNPHESIFKALTCTAEIETLLLWVSWKPLRQLLLLLLRIMLLRQQK